MPRVKVLTLFVFVQLFLEFVKIRHFNFVVEWTGKQLANKLS